MKINADTHTRSAQPTWPRALFIGLSVLLPILATHAVAAGPSLEEAWELNRMLEFNEAEKWLREHDPETEEDQSRTAFSRAITLLSVQPRTTGNIEEADRLLGNIVASEAVSELIAWSLYYQGRIDQLHLVKPDPASALKHYGDLIFRFPDHIAAQLGFIKSGIIRLYAAPGEGRPVATLASLENEAGFLSSPFAKNQFHRLMADGYLFFDLSRERALEHLLAARALGSFEIIDLGGDYLRMANIAYELGRRDLARKNYRKYLEMRPKSNATYLVRERIEELGEGRLE